MDERSSPDIPLAHLKSKLVFCVSVIFMLVLIKLSVFEGNELFTIGGFSLHILDTENETNNQKYGYISYLNLSGYDQTNRQQFLDDVIPGLPTYLSKTPLKGFSYNETCFFETYPNFTRSPYDAKEFDILKTPEGRKYKTILAYHHAYEKTFYFGFGYKLFKSACCRETRCFITDRRNDIENFDAILFHFRGFKHEDLPKIRRKHQRWIFYEREPPTLSSNNPGMYEGIFNWTMTYRRDSDIAAVYGKLYAKLIFSHQDFSKFGRNTRPPEVLLKTKTKLVAWMVSHCNAQSKRDQYTQQLQKYIKVDIYGKCGRLVCDRKKTLQCYEMIEKKYKFYLSFENSFCTDYVTEKFFYLLNYYVVPVVRGSCNYSAYAPPHSYIDVRDFRSQRELAQFLKYLDKNDTAYLEYFKWKQDYISLTGNWVSHAGSFCDLCYRLHNDRKEKIYYNLKEWFHGKSKCM